MDFCKGHGTENDFIVLPDLAARIELSTDRVARLCDRQRGLGADGVLRVARAGALVTAGAVPSDAVRGFDADDWFMDYRNADGSIAEMCGNGVRVFAHYLRASGMEERDEFVVGSRAGARSVVVHSAGPVHGDVTVDMGPVAELGASRAVVGGREIEGLGIDVGNPHLACVVDGGAATLAGWDLTGLPEFDTALFPRGVNVEIVTRLDGGRGVDMRVHERGVGETRSCGTGTVAAAYAALRCEGLASGEVEVRVPGGRVRVRIGDDTTYLRGPSALVARGQIDDDWWTGR
ncbi:diaminopimelate epimerase [Tomitella biformata]|uniref:diaminopimelate epimerase n=1 Tax=Tomitella biformata TaxID=630403 RepID=UPI000464CC7E|nr:diaminopimelate epimerase [Tomitella biformata]